MRLCGYLTHSAFRLVSLWMATFIMHISVTKRDAKIHLISHYIPFPFPFKASRTLSFILLFDPSDHNLPHYEPTTEMASGDSHFLCRYRSFMRVIYKSAISKWSNENPERKREIEKERRIELMSAHCLPTQLTLPEYGQENRKIEKWRMI